MFQLSFFKFYKSALAHFGSRVLAVQPGSRGEAQLVGRNGGGPVLVPSCGEVTPCCGQGQGSGHLGGGRGDHVSEADAQGGSETHDDPRQRPLGSQVQEAEISFILKGLRIQSLLNKHGCFTLMLQCF